MKAQGFGYFRQVVRPRFSYTQKNHRHLQKLFTKELRLLRFNPSPTPDPTCVLAGQLPGVSR